MPPLAERRKKSKWMNPGRQALWNRDSGDTKFGREMMEKMGWKVGQGLGINKQGIKEPLKVNFKNDNKGMGYKENDSEWIQQQCEFDELLSKLSSGNEELPKESQTNTVQSLEERSRLSKARVHYHKFTRGKDLAKYSKKDLECILGRNEKESSSNQSNLENLNDNTGTENESLITAGSMVEYFAEKMKSKLKKKTESSNVENSGEAENSLGNNSKDELGDDLVNARMELDEKKKKKSKRKKDKDEDGCDGELGDEIDFNNVPGDFKMKSNSEGHKERKKAKISDADDQSNPLDEDKGCEGEITKSEIIQMQKEEKNVCESNLEVNEDPGEKLKKKKKKRKKEENLVEEFDTENGEALNVDENKNEDYKEAEENVNSLTSVEPLKKKKKTSKRDREVIADEVNDAGELKENIKKKKKKSLELENFSNDKVCTTDENLSNPVPDTETIVKKSKKEKSKSKRKSAEEDGQCNKEETIEKEKEKEEEDEDEEPLLYKGELLKKECAFKKANQNKLLSLIHCSNVEKFSGSNLGILSGYGFVSYR